MVWSQKPRSHNIWYTGRTADRALRSKSCENAEVENDQVAKLQKNAPNDLKSLDAELKSAPAFCRRNAADAFDYRRSAMSWS
jgi:hypothetical protein